MLLLQRRRSRLSVAFSFSGCSSQRQRLNVQRIWAGFLRLPARTFGRLRTNLLPGGGTACRGIRLFTCLVSLLSRSPVGFGATRKACCEYFWTASRSLVWQRYAPPCLRPMQPHGSFRISANRQVLVLLDSLPRGHGSPGRRVFTVC